MLSCASLILVLQLVGCHWDMWNNARIKPHEPSPFFEDGQSARMTVEGTIPYHAPRTDDHLYTGRVDGEYAAGLPEGMTLDRALLERGQARFNIYCIVCHGETGEGNGIIVQRGFPTPPAYVDLLRRDPPSDQLGYYFDVMTNGFGRMYSYANRVSVEDRWAIAAYIRVLQLSQYATPETVPASVLEQAREQIAAAQAEPAEAQPDEEQH